MPNNDDEFLINIDGMIRFIESPANDNVKAYIIRNTNKSSCMFLSTILRTGMKAGVSKKTAIKAFEWLQKEDFIRKLSRGVWVVNPNLFLPHGTGKHESLVKLYMLLPQDNNEKITEERKAEIQEAMKAV